MATTKTTAAKALETAAGQHPEDGKRGLYDAAAKRLVAVRYILAWIVKKCIREASQFSVKDIATKYITGDPYVMQKPVYRDDTEAEDPGRAKLDQTEDASVSEGTVRYDILFTLDLPGKEAPITVIVNIELQNRADLDYPLIARAVSYVARMLGSQGPNYNNLHKVYSIWVISNPRHDRENTIDSYTLACRTAGRPLRAIEKDGDLLEIVFLNLGEPEAVRDPENPDILWLLDVLFSKTMDITEKKNILESDFDIPMTRKMEEELETMQDKRLWFEVEAENRGLKQGFENGQRQMLYSLIQDGILSAATAAKKLGITEKQLMKDMQAAADAHAVS